MRKMSVLLILSISLLCACASTTWATQFEIAYEKTFTEAEFDYWRTSYGYDEGIFGETAGPSLLQVSLTLDPDAAPSIFRPEGSSIFLLGSNHTIIHDLYGYAKGAIIQITATFGTKTWDFDDLQEPVFGLGSFALWMDAPLVDGGTSNIILNFVDDDGDVAIGWMWMSYDEYGMYQDGRADVRQYDPFIGTLFGDGGVATIHVIDTPVPEPASLLLFGTGLGVIGLAAWRRRK